MTEWLTFAEPSTAERLDEHVARLRAVHVEARRVFTVATGVGALDCGSSGLLASIDSAVDGVRIAAARAATGWFVRSDALGPEQLLLSWTTSDAFVPAATALLAPSPSTAPKLGEALAAYLDHESGVSATATALALHRNTDSMRIARTQEMLGEDLAGPDAGLAVHPACRVLWG